MLIEFEGDRNTFLNLLRTNNGVMIFKFTADWCKPCQSIKNFIDTQVVSITSDTIKCFEVDIDECFDLFAFMKTKKMMKGIPTIMAYRMGTTNYVSDDSISGTDINEINAFFARCQKM